MSLAEDPERARIVRVYAGRASAGLSSLYAWHRPEVRFAAYRFHACCAKALVRSGSDLAVARILDVGCGAGQWLATLLQWGSAPDRLHGVDLVSERVEAARAILPAQATVCLGKGGALPFEPESFDLVTANTVFSSILEPGARSGLAGDIMRVLRPGGVALIYDFRFDNPGNRDVLGIRRREIRRLFGSNVTSVQTLTLAPPISRRIAPFSLPLAALLEWCCPILRSHALYTIRK